MEPKEVLPCTYPREKLLACLDYCRRKSKETIGVLSKEQAFRLCRFAWEELAFAGFQLYNLHHVQEHGAQLCMFLGSRQGNLQDGNPGPRRRFLQRLTGRAPRLYFELEV